MSKMKPSQSPQGKATSFPKWWHIVHLLLLGLGLLLAVFNPQWLNWLSGLSARVRTDAWSRFIGIYLASISDLFIFYTMSGFVKE